MEPDPPRPTFEGPPLPLPEELGPLTLGGFLADVVAVHGDRQALVFDDPLRDGETVRWSYSELLDEANRIAAALIAAGTEPGARIAIRMGNRTEYVAALFGIARAGAVAVPLSTFAAATETEAMLQLAQPRLLLTQTALAGRQLEAPDGIDSVSVGTHGWEHFLADGRSVADAEVERRVAATEPDDEGLILFSSGTSATPKAMVHAHRAPVLQFRFQADLFRRRTDSRVWAPLPLFWTAGLTTALGPTLAAGGTFVLQEVFDAGDALALMERERVTEPYVLPHQGAALAEHPDWEQADLSSLRETYGKSVFHRHPRVQGDPTWMPPAGYGMSETCATVIAHRWDTPREVIAASTGKLLPGMQLRIVDPESGEPLEQGLTGELALAGPMMMLGYLGKDRAETFDSDGFLRTGDAGYVDEEGAIHWTGRLTEMIKTAGANVAPAELELELRTCPDVRRCRVVGLPDVRLGEVVTLCAELVDGSDATAEDLRQFLAERVASYKVPREVVLFAEGELPTTASGAKVRDDELISLAAERLGRS